MTQISHCWAYTLRKLELKETHVPQCSSQHCLQWNHPRCPLADKWIRKLWYIYTMEYSVQFSHSVVSNSLRPHESQNARPPCPSPLPEFTQTHVHQVGDAIQPSHPLSSPSPAPNPSQHQNLFQWVNSSHEVAKVLEFQLQHHSFQRTPRTDLL